MKDSELTDTVSRAIDEISALWKAEVNNEV